MPDEEVELDDDDDDDGEHNAEEIQENVEQRIELAVDLLEDHPYVVNTWSSDLGRELTAYFKQVNPDTNELEYMLQMEEYGTWLINSDKRGDVDVDGEVLLAKNWDLCNTYHYLIKEEEEVPFTEWSDDFEWRIEDWHQTIEEFLGEVGYVKGGDSG